MSIILITLKVLGGVVVPIILIGCVGAMYGRLIRAHNRLWMKLWLVPVVALSTITCCSHSLTMIADGHQLMSSAVFGSMVMLWTGFLSAWLNLRLFRWIPVTISNNAQYFGAKILYQAPVPTQRLVFRMMGIRGRSCFRGN